MPSFCKFLFGLWLVAVSALVAGAITKSIYDESNRKHAENATLSAVPPQPAKMPGFKYQTETIPGEVSGWNLYITIIEFDDGQKFLVTRTAEGVSVTKY